MTLKQMKPAVRKEMLLFFSGAVWVGVGSMLTRLAAGWIGAIQGNVVFIPAGLGLITALVITHFGFLRVVDKNFGRISRMEGKRCAFSFMSWKSYLLVLVMTAMGMLLRHSPIPKPYLAVVYLGIGGALILSSIRYFRRLLVALRDGRGNDAL